ncbi:hypothetical protein DLAC_06616 [Tieghemostelium lacteum]|uniref:BRCT domain-containing protein n=1 Tax=Tieghemostelium lacteum TaxID=361077 RepID=A0A151ZFH5_TIELA|nr:hypothetical protein DLAC_06616 [Tieghemostelium lacteum]|eukprot:KYQ92620.1 hypothetical protein DLAC_06616 [Tieghemostelium lacteum]
MTYLSTNPIDSVLESPNTEPLKLFKNLYFAFDKSILGNVSAQLRKTIKNHGGDLKYNIEHEHANYLIANPKRYSSQSKQSIQCKFVGKPIISLDFIRDCVDRGILLDYKEYLISDIMPDVVVQFSNGDSDVNNEVKKNIDNAFKIVKSDVLPYKSKLSDILILLNNYTDLKVKGSKAFDNDTKTNVDEIKLNTHSCNSYTYQIYPISNVPSDYDLSLVYTEYEDDKYYHICELNRTIKRKYSSFVNWVV